MAGGGGREVEGEEIGKSGDESAPDEFHLQRLRREEVVTMMTDANARIADFSYMRKQRREILLHNMTVQLNFVFMYFRGSDHSPFFPSCKHVAQDYNYERIISYFLNRKRKRDTAHIPT
jgi:hypothetical protein